MAGGLVALRSFWLLKKGTIIFNFCSNEPFPSILRLLVDAITTRENKQKNKHASKIFLLAKITNIHILADGSFTIVASTTGFLDTLNLTV